MFKENIDKSLESYLNFDYSKFKKYERIDFIVHEISKNIDVDKQYTFLDIGCAKGEFIYILKEKFSNIKFTGVEISNELLKMAKKEPFLNDVIFIEDDARFFNTNQKYDFVLMSGVLSIFDDFNKPLQRMTEHIKPNGIGYIFEAFNKDDIDVLVRFRNNFKKSQEWESGWNLFSLKTIKSFLKPISKKIKILNFKIQKTIKKKADPVSSYTIDLKKNKEKLITTGGGIVRDFYLIIFQKIK